MDAVLLFPMKGGTGAFAVYDIYAILPTSGVKDCADIYTSLFPGGVTIEVASELAIAQWLVSLDDLDDYDEDEEEELEPEEEEEEEELIE